MMRLKGKFPLVMTLNLRKPLTLLAIYLGLFSPGYLFSQEKDNNDYLVTTKGETFYGKVKFKNGGYEGESFAIVKAEKGQESKFSIAEVKYFFKDSLRFEPKRYKPDKKKYFLYFLPLIMQNGKMKIFLGGYTYKDLDNSRFHLVGPDLFGPVNSYLYYLYEDDEFKLKITKKNYREVIATHFPECQALLAELNSKRNYFDYGEFLKLSAFYGKNCQ